MKRKFLSIANKSLTDFGATSYKDLWEKAKKEGYDGLSLSVDSVFTKSEGDPENKFHAVFSSAREDRHGEIVYQEFDLKAFKKNPVYLDSHNYDSIIHIIGRVQKINAKGGQLEGDVEFFLDNPIGMLGYKAASQGFLNTSSIGFIPKKFDDKGNILESELLEISAVSVPANADALFEKKEEEEEIKKEEVKETEVEIKEEPKKITKAQIIAKIAQDREKILKGIAKSVQELVEENKIEKKRKIFRLLRDLSKN